MNLKAFITNLHHLLDFKSSISSSEKTLGKKLIASRTKQTMQTEIYWTNEKLATMPKPNGGQWLENEIISLKDEGVDVLVSMLEDHEIESFELGREKEFCSKHLITYLNFPILDRNLPESFEDVYKFVQKLSKYAEVNKKIAFHCFAGIGRSSLIACCLMVLQGMNVDDAFSQISDARGFPVPDTQAQLEWAYTFAEKFGDKIN